MIRFFVFVLTVYFWVLMIQILRNLFLLYWQESPEAVESMNRWLKVERENVERQKVESRLSKIQILFSHRFRPHPQCCALCMRTGLHCIDQILEKGFHQGFSWFIIFDILLFDIFFLPFHFRHFPFDLLALYPSTIMLIDSQ